MSALIEKFNHVSIAWDRWFPVICILLAFARLSFDLDAKTVWWDESLSLQRSEQGWRDLLAGKLALWDSERERITWDQHPAAFYVALGLLLRASTDSPFALRFVSLCAATLLVPVAWGFARFLARKRLVPQGTEFWATALVALNPFILWYGQEARPYALWMLVSLLAVWALWEWVDTWSYVQERFDHNGRWAILYLVALLLSLGTHYYSLMMLPIHGLLVAVYLLRVERKFAIEVMTFVLVLTGTLVFVVYRFIMSQPGAGSNFAPVDIWTVGQELVHAFGTGLSARLDQVGWLDTVFIALGAYGIYYAVRSKEVRQVQGWFLGLYLLLPVALLFALSFVQPNYMAARHHAQLIGVFLVLVASGLAALSSYHLRATWVCGLLLMGGTAYSSWRYYESPYYGKAPDYDLVGRILEDQIREGDLVVFKGPNSWRLFRYYFPMEEIEAAQAAGFHVNWEAMPPIRVGQWLLNTQEHLADTATDYERVWMLEDRTLPYEDPDHEVLLWLRGNMHQHKDWGFFHPNSSLALFLFLPEDPNPVPAIPLTTDVEVGATFDGTFRLEAIEIGQRLWDASQLPLTLYWRVEDPPRARYRYIVWLYEVLPDGTQIKLPHTEQFGAFPDRATPAGQFQLDFSNVEAPTDWQESSRYLLHVMIYDIQTGAKLPISETGGLAQKDDEPALIIPLPLAASDLG